MKLARLVLVGVSLVAATASASPFVLESTMANGTKASLTIGGYVDAFYQWNFNNPSTGITNFRGFDNRHNSFTIANAVLDVAGKIGFVSGQVILQVGHTPETYYLAEPTSPGASGAAATGAPVWKFLQKAAATLRFPIGRGLYVDGGLLITPIGPESFAWKDNWNLSRSNLFFGCPFYHTGIKIYYPVTNRFTVSMHVYNGWNSVVDNNPEKTLAFQTQYEIADKVNWSFVYMTGVERARGAAEGRSWRHLFDSYVGYFPNKWLSLSLNVNGGVEPNHFGTSWWAAFAAYVRVMPLSWLRFTARADFFREHAAQNSEGAAGSIFWPVGWVSEFTFSTDFRPFDNVSIRFDFRHDEADGPMYFKSNVGLGLDGQPIATAKNQDTLTVGLTTWF